jgi:hypothetical protein
VDERGAIQNVISSYSDAVSRRDWALLSDLFTAQSTWEIVGSQFRFQGDKIAPGVRGMVEPASYLVQLPSQSIIDINVDTANARTLVQEHCLYEKSPLTGEKSRFHCLGLYTDVLAKRGGRWKFVSRSFSIFNNDVATG